MKSKNSVNILWLSDIHFRKDYNPAPVKASKGKDGSTAKEKEENKKKIQQLGKLDGMINAFLKKVKQVNNELSKNREYLDYILISGDLAFSGVKEDYTAFKEKILDPVMSICNKHTKCITISGNHDVNWDIADSLDYFLKEMDGLSLKDRKEKIAEHRMKYFAKNTDQFLNIFQYYSEFHNDSIAPYFKDNANVSYKDHGLFGVIEDKENNLVFNLLNSAWFALGDKFDYLLQNYISKTNGKTIETKVTKNRSWDEIQPEFKKTLQKAVTLKTITSEYGEQILGENDEEQNIRMALLDDNPGSFVITCFHHPLNWLQYAQKYDMHSAKNDGLYLNKILKDTSLLLTGHEHVPSSTKPEKLSNSTCHLKAGMFMQDNMFTDVYEGEFRFSLLRIDTKNFSFGERKFVFNGKKNEWTENDPYSVSKIVIEKRRYKWHADKHEMLNKAIQDPMKVKEMLELHFYKKVSKIQEVKGSSTEQYNVFFVKTDGDKKFIVVPKSEDFFQEMGKIPTGSCEYKHMFDEVVKYMIRKDTSTRTITLLTPDFLVDKSIQEKYLDAKKDMNDIFSEIVKRGDFAFNIARHHFFDRFEQLISGWSRFDKELIINDIRFSDISEIRFSNLIVPFWTVEKVAKNGGIHRK